jgi:prepilin-type N-terminal cleavage/methylation domain-containing protein
MNSKNSGFTLIELLVVIAIIGLLASIVLVSLNSARGKARDTKRKADLAQIVIAMEMYYDKYNTYIIPNTGWSSCSCGWFNYESGSYAKSIAHGIEETNLIAKAPRDPSISSDNQTPQYMKYQCGNGFFVYAKLENPSAEDTATYTASKNAGCGNLDEYGMNYAAGHK